MKSQNKTSLLIGVIIGALSVLLVGQSKPASVTPTPMHYTALSTTYGVLVLDTYTGNTKLLSGDPRNAAPTARMEYGTPFSP